MKLGKLVKQHIKQINLEMSSAVESLFTSTRGLQASWVVSKINFDTSRRRIDFELNCTAKKAACPHCNAPEQGIHDRLERQWMHFDFFQFEAWLHAKVPRIACTVYGKTSQMLVPWAREGSGFTALFEALALSLCQSMPVRQAAQMLRCEDKRLWRRVSHYVQEACARQDMSGVSLVEIDETRLRKCQNYITVVHDLKGKRLLFACEGCRHKTVLDFTGNFKVHGGEPEKIEHVCMDMSAAYTKGVSTVLPGAQISYDRFTIVAMANEVMDNVRREEVKAQPQAVKKVFGDNKPKLCKSLAWAMRPNPCDWNASHADVMHLLQRSWLKSTRAWRLKMALPEVYAKAAQSSDESAAKDKFKAWLSWAGLDAAAWSRSKRWASGLVQWCAACWTAAATPCRGHERAAALASKARRQRIQNCRQPHRHRHRHRLSAHLQIQALVRQSLLTRSGTGIWTNPPLCLISNSTRNGIEPNQSTYKP